MESRNGFWNKNVMIYHFITLVIISDYLFYKLNKKFYLIYLRKNHIRECMSKTPWYSEHAPSTTCPSHLAPLEWPLGTPWQKTP